MSKQVQKVCNAISTAAVVLVVILALLLVGVRLVGLRPMCVLSGSMEPTYHTGSLIYVKPCAPEDVQVGDAITFVLNEDLDVVTHRVISIDAENEHFYTQGDANDAPDGAPVYFKNLIGRPVFTIPYLGYVSHWVSNPPGMYLAIAIAIVLIVLAFLPDMLRKAAEADARVKLVMNWVDDTTGNIVSGDNLPNVTLNSDNSWFLGSDGIYYYKMPVAANNGETTNLLKTPITEPTEGKPDGCHLEVTVLAESIQAAPSKAVQQSWGVGVDSNGYLTQPTTTP